jgi:hypothetical protein
MVLLILTWALIGLLIGVTGAYLGPGLVAFAGGPELRDRVGRWLIGTVLTLLGSTALVVKDHGGVALRPTSEEPKMEADAVTVDGEKGHLKDAFGVKGYLTGTEFGIGIDSAPVYVSPLLAELGEAAADAMHSDRLGVQPDGGVRMDFELPRQVTLPDLSRTRHLLAGSADLRDGVVAENWTRYSQEKFHSNLGIKETLLLVGAFAVGVTLAILAMRYGTGGGGGGGGTTLPIMIGLGVGL